MRVRVRIDIDEDGVRGYGSVDNLELHVECEREYTTKGSIKPLADAAAAKALAAVEAQPS